MAVYYIGFYSFQKNRQVNESGFADKTNQCLFLLQVELSRFKTISNNYAYPPGQINTPEPIDGKDICH
jgi:hypothetical protein